MDIKAYIESGILEQYVLGQLSADEAREVEAYARQHPEIRSELDAIERSLESYAQLHSKTLPAGTLSRIFQKIDAPLAAISSNQLLRNRLRLIRGIAVVFVLFSLGLATYIGVDKQKQTQVKQQLLACDALAQELAVLQQELNFLKDIDTRPVVMNGTPVAPNAVAAVYVNADSRRVYLGNLDLPVPPVGKQYQLWAIVNDTPVSMGVFDLPARAGAFLKVPFVADAQAFAISLEDAGGKATPTLEQIVVLGTAG
ncbi:MAG TPA: anti-sigma factor [Saprospiraceae bacterium]|nr:anti-sigma factor [Saprospiraceae bacterium]HMP14406.1 anti-sigma factor [Saprospiraceae bacterium]